MSSLFRRKLDELEGMFIQSQDDLLARFEKVASENARLKAEVERLTESRDRQVEINHELDDLCTRLKAEVERLRKAGDELAKNFKVQTWPWTSRFNCYLAWNAAKEGKQP